MGELLQLRDEHEQAQMLLPWYVNGTLDAGEETLFEAHLARCEECCADLTANQALRGLYANMPLGTDTARPTLLATLESGLPAERRPAWRLSGRAMSSGWARAAQGAVAAAAAATLFLAFMPSQPGSDEYRLLGSEEAGQPGNAIVLFSPDTAERDLRAALDGVGARLVDGPTASGAYVVRIAADRRAEGLDELRALPQVMLAEPIDAGPGS